MADDAEADASSRENAQLAASAATAAAAEIPQVLIEPYGTTVYRLRHLAVTSSHIVTIRFSGNFTG